MRTRFAPSPTGYLHIGHAHSALFGYRLAQDNGGEFILRIEDIDLERCHDKFIDGFYEDLAWLGIKWQEPARKQSDHFDTYASYLDTLTDMDLLYPCFCTRKDIKAEINASGSAPHKIPSGPEGYHYPGTCKKLGAQERQDKMKGGIPYAMRLNVDKAIEIAGKDLKWNDHGKGEQTATPGILGDAVIARKDIKASYHLCVTIDDHLQDISLVTRGNDLFYATHLHRLLQELLGLNVPDYHHHSLLLDEFGKRFAKRNNAVTLNCMREKMGLSAEEVIAKIDSYKKADLP